VVEIGGERAARNESSDASPAYWIFGSARSEAEDNAGDARVRQRPHAEFAGSLEPWRQGPRRTRVPRDAPPSGRRSRGNDTLNILQRQIIYGRMRGPVAQRVDRRLVEARVRSELRSVMGSRLPERVTGVLGQDSTARKRRTRPAWPAAKAVC